MNQPEAKIRDLTGDALTAMWKVNALSHHNVIRYFHPLLLKSKDPLRAVVSISSSAGSVTLSRVIYDAQAALYSTDKSPLPSYNITKGSIAAISQQWALDLENDGIRVFAMDPGLVFTGRSLGSPLAHAVRLLRRHPSR